MVTTLFSGTEAMFNSAVAVMTLLLVVTYLLLLAMQRAPHASDALRQRLGEAVRTP